MDLMKLLSQKEVIIGLVVIAFFVVAYIIEWYYDYIENQDASFTRNHVEFALRPIGTDFIKSFNYFLEKEVINKLIQTHSENSVVAASGLSSLEKKIDHEEISQKIYGFLNSTPWGIHPIMFVRILAPVRFSKDEIKLQMDREEIFANLVLYHHKKSRTSLQAILQTLHEGLRDAFENQKIITDTLGQNALEDDYKEKLFASFSSASKRIELEAKNEALRLEIHTANQKTEQDIKDRLGKKYSDAVLDSVIEGFQIFDKDDFKQAMKIKGIFVTVLIIFLCFSLINYIINLPPVKVALLMEWLNFERYTSLKIDTRVINHIKFFSGALVLFATYKIVDARIKHNHRRRWMKNILNALAKNGLYSGKLQDRLPDKAS